PFTLVEVCPPRQGGKKIKRFTGQKILTQKTCDCISLQSQHSEAEEWGCCDSEVCLDDTASTGQIGITVSKETDRKELTQEPTQHTNAAGLAVPSVALGSAEVSSWTGWTCQFSSPTPVIKIWEQQTPHSSILKPS
ncbi:hypothetical protein LEMLEM_LOCUS14803, partial [Lemmus lemmus]